MINLFTLLSFPYYSLSVKQKHKNSQGSLHLELESHWPESDLREKKISEI